jgi:hypothetical protein
MHSAAWLAVHRHVHGARRWIEEGIASRRGGAVFGAAGVAPLVGPAQQAWSAVGRVQVRERHRFVGPEVARRVESRQRNARAVSAGEAELAREARGEDVPAEITLATGRARAPWRRVVRVARHAVRTRPAGRARFVIVREDLGLGGGHQRACRAHRPASAPLGVVARDPRGGCDDGERNGSLNDGSLNGASRCRHACTLQDGCAKRGERGEERA